MPCWLWPFTRWSPERARDALCAGRVPTQMRVRGALNLSRRANIRALPRFLRATTINVSGCFALRCMPDDLECEELILDQTNIESLPERLSVSRRISARDCRGLQTIPPVVVDRLDLSGCSSLARLPQGLAARQLDLAGCVRLAWLPASVALAARHLNLNGCTGLTGLPDAFGPLDVLNVGNCPNIQELPEGIRVRLSVEVAGSGLRGLPWSLRSTTVRWRGVPVSDRIAFGEPNDFTLEDVTRERNLTMRRVLLERVGLDWLLDRGNAIAVDQDQDRGGERRLLRFALEGGEDIVCVVVHCPSTGNRYVLRVPPSIRSCREAVAWTAGFTDADAYRPEVET